MERRYSLLPEKITIATGGTGGHIFPAVAFADAMRKLNPQVLIRFSGGKNSMEAQKIPLAGYPIDTLTIHGIYRTFSLKNVYRNLTFPLVYFGAIITATKRLNEFKPDLILIMYTYPNRKEYYTETGGIEPYHPNPWGYFDEDREGRLEWAGIVSSSNEENDLMNWYKNHLLITYYLKDKGIPFLWNGTFIGTDYKDDNRFDGNYPSIKDTHQHATYLENKEYAQKLYNHIEKLGILKK
jgi:hypothetical protein